jgi:hypothetical protein
MWAVSWEGVSKCLPGESFTGFIRVLMLVWVRVWGVLVRHIGNGMISTFVLGQCERSAFARGCISSR